MYLDLDCHNFAVDLRVKLGDWFKVVNLLKRGGGAGRCGLYIHVHVHVCSYVQCPHLTHHPSSQDWAPCVCSLVWVSFSSFLSIC